MTGVISIIVVSMVIRGVLMFFLPEEEDARRKVTFWANLALVLLILALVGFVAVKLLPTLT